MSTILLVLPTGTYRADAYLAAAGRLGLDVVVGSERAQALSAAMGDSFVELPLSDPPAAADAIVRHAERVRLDAIVSVDDEGLLGAALAAARLGLRHSPPAAVAATRDKVSMRELFASGGVPQPRFVEVSDGGPEGVERAAGRIGGVVVVKPKGLSGSRGVIRADTPKDAARAAGRIRAILAEAGEPPGSALLVESFVEGPEVAVDAILDGGRATVVAIFDKPDPLDGPYFEETFYVTPSRLPPGLLAAVESAVFAAAAALGLSDGPLHAELRIPGTPHEPVVVLEVAARTIGGRCSAAVRLAGGHSLEELVLATAVGVPGPAPVLEGPAGVLMIPIPSSGRLVAVHGKEAAAAVPGVTSVEVTIPPGRKVMALPEGDRYLGFVFARGDSPELVEAALREAGRCLDVEIAVTKERPD